MAYQVGIIRNLTSGLVLDAREYVVKVQPFTGFPPPSQLWTFEPVGNGAFFIRNRENGNVLDIQGGAESDANIITYEKHGGENQQWYIHPDNTIVCASGNLALDIAGGECTPGIEVIAYPKHGDAREYIVTVQPFTGFPRPSQLWTFEAAGNGAFFIRNSGNGKVLDIQGGAESDANIITYQKHGGVNQQWYIHPDNTIVCASGSLALDIAGGRCTSGIKVIAYPKHGRENQRFAIQYQ